MLQRVAIYFKDNNEKTLDSVNKLVDEFHNRGIKIRIHQKLLTPASESVWNIIEKAGRLSFKSELPDLVLSVGGDGTFLETVLNVRDMGIPIAGVNTGRMGFLANISTGEIEKSVDMLCNNDYEIIERCLLEVKKPLGLFGESTSLALNEVTVQKADQSMITINVYLDDIHLNTYWADGLIVSTATGSTAYNLSVGGPILSPGDESIIISPIAPHNLTIRPIILSGEGKIRMVIEGRSNDYLATCDFRSKRLPFSEEVHIVRSDVKIKTVMLNGRDFYSTLRSKLMWGADFRN
jgi:NAD+ kinase